MTEAEGAGGGGVRPIDTHVHFWELAGYRGYDGWFRGRDYLRRDYLPHHLRPELAAIGAAGAVIVGAAPDSHRHNLEWGAMCEQHPDVLGLVGSYSMTSPRLGEWLDAYAGRPWFLGIRSQPQLPPDRWDEDAAADRGARELRRRGLVLDILVEHTLIPAVGGFARRHEELTLVLNHCGLPPFRDGDLGLWERHVRALAAVPNVVVKYSSFFLHCHPRCDPEQLRRAAGVLFEAFGSERLLWGSNWPPELVGGSYGEAFATMLDSAPTLTASERARVLRDNAVRVYRLPVT